MRRVFRYLLPYKGVTVLSLALKVLGSASELLLPYILSHIIDDLVPLREVQPIVRYGLLMLFFALMALGGNVLANRFSALAAGRMTHDLRHDLFRHISSLRCQQVDRFTIPSLISRLSSDTYNVNATLVRVMRRGIRAPILLIGGIVITLVLDPVLSLVMIATTPFIGAVVYYVTKKSVPAFVSVQEGLDEMLRCARENITGVRVIRALSKTGHERERFHGIADRLSEREYYTDRLSAFTNPATTLILNVGLVLVILVGASRHTPSGVILAFLSYFTTILNAVIGITVIFTAMPKGMASAERISQVLETESELPLTPAEDAETDPTGAAIRFDDVSFSYNKVSEDIDHISFSVRPGQTLGIIGSTGSGKSTLVHLLLRMYDADSGRIFIDGRDIRTIPREELASMFGIAFQNGFLMADTIYENVSYGRDLPREDVQEALDIAQAAEFVSALDEGMDHVVAQKAGNLSGGQKQRISVARSVAAKPRILILDDSSSALDYKTDSRLRQALSSMPGIEAKIIISQRIASIRDADLILVLDNGHLVGKGTHDELLRDCPDYAEIASLQGGTV